MPKYRVRPGACRSRGEGCRDSSPEARFTLQSGRRRPALADRLETAYGRETKVLALTIPDREKMLAALEDAPADLAELRGMLLRELEWRRAEGLT